MTTNVYDKPTYEKAKIAYYQIKLELKLPKMSSLFNLEEAMEETLTLRDLWLFANPGISFEKTNCIDVVVANRFLTDLSQQDTLNKVWNRYVEEHKLTTTTVQIVQLATDPRCLVEINALAVID